MNVADSGADGSGENAFAAKLRKLFDVVPRSAEEGGGKYAVSEVAAGVGVSRQHLYDLLSGKKTRPAWDLVTRLAEFFGVSVVYFGNDEAAERSPGREWGILALQGVVGLLAGGLVWFGFRYLWMFNSIAALIAALVVTGALVLVARKVLRTDDLQTILLAVLVGLACTVSPVALMMLSR